MPAEALLPGTDAITRCCIEWVKYREKHLVRYRNLEGYAVQRQFDSQSEAYEFFSQCIERLRAEVRG